MQPSEPGRGDHVAGQPSALISIQCLLPLQSLLTTRFSSHRLCRYHICHFPGCRCTKHSSPCPQECPCTAPFSSRSSCFPTLLAQSMQAAPLPGNSHGGYDPTAPQRLYSHPAIAQGQGLGLSGAQGFAEVVGFHHCIPKCTLKFLQRLWEDRMC